MARTTLPIKKPKTKKLNRKERIKNSLINKADYLNEFPLKNNPEFNKLTYREKRFIYNIFLKPITNWSNGKAYSEAYDNPNLNTSYVEASKLIKNPKISKFLEIIRESYNTELYTNADKILKEEANIAYSDPGELFDEDGDLILPIKKLPERVRKSIKGFEVIENRYLNTTRYKVTLWDKGASLGRLESISGINAPKKYELSGPDGGPIRYDIRKIEIVLVRPGDIREKGDEDNRYLLPE